MKTLTVLCLIALTSGMPAATIATLFNTGVNASGLALPDDAPDPHWLLVAPGALEGSPLVATAAGGFPIPPWLGDSAESAWITTLLPSALGPTNVTREYHYQTAFSLAGLNPSTAAISGRTSQDNVLFDILINGTSTGITESAISFTGWTDFSFTPEHIALLQEGDNTLTFIVQSATTDGSDDYTSLRVEFLTRTADPVPEPTLAALSALGALGLLRRRRA